MYLLGAQIRLPCFSAWWWCFAIYLLPLLAWWHSVLMFIQRPNLNENWGKSLKRKKKLLLLPAHCNWTNQNWTTQNSRGVRNVKRAGCLWNSSSKSCSAKICVCKQLQSLLPHPVVSFLSAHALSLPYKISILVACFRDAFRHGWNFYRNSYVFLKIRWCC